MNNRRIFLLGVCGALAGCWRVKLRRLNVYNWSDYIAHNTITNFEDEFQVKVRYATYESTEELLAKALTGNSGWDVVFPSNSYVEPMRQLKLLAPLDLKRLPLLHHLEDRFQHPPWDTSLDWCVPYMHGATGILFSRSGAKALNAWSDLWNSQLAQRMTMMDDPAEVFGACLKRNHHSVNTDKAAMLQEAKALAVQQKKLLRAYLNAEVKDQVIAGDVLAAQAWTITAQQTISQGQNTNLAFVYPQEGFPLYADNVCILRESKRPELAHDFLNYLLRPNVAAQIALEMETGTANEAARALLPSVQRDNKLLYPDAAVLARGEWFSALAPPVQRLRDRLWTELKAA